MPELQINSREYWDNRFENNWDERSGREQSRFFSHVAIELIPTWLRYVIHSRDLTVCDWGCAEGDGTDVLGEIFDPKYLTGVDFSSRAIARASAAYPHIPFLNEDWVACDEPQNAYDVVFTSNTLEHFHDPHLTMRKLFNVARKCLIVMIPYREFERHEEHHFTFTGSNLHFKPTEQFTLVHAQVADTSKNDPVFWPGMQILLVYARNDFVDTLKLNLSDVQVIDEKLHFSADEKKTLADTIENINSELSLTSTRLIESLDDNIHLKDQIIDLISELSSKNEKILELSNDLISKSNFFNSEKTVLIDALGEANRRIETHSRDMVTEAQRANLLQDEIKAIRSSRGWRIATSVHKFRRRFSWSGSIMNPNKRYKLLRNIYWRLPHRVRVLLDSHKVKYVQKHLNSYSARDGSQFHQESVIEVDAPWIKWISSSAKVAIVTCSFEFDELVNQRPINLAKYLAENGYAVIFVAWQWTPEEKLKKGCGEVWKNIFQVPLFEFASLISRMPKKVEEAHYFACLPAPKLTAWVFDLRALGYTIIYDIMDEWEAFHLAGQAPWYDIDVERALVLESDLVTCVAPSLKMKFSDIRNDVEVIGNGYSVNVNGEDARGIAINNSELTTIGYFGHLTDAWFDWNLVFEIANNNREVQFEIIGYGEPRWVRERAQSNSNVKLIGKVHPSELKNYVSQWSHGIIPFVEGDLARAVDPIKIYEYLYYGLQTFVTGIEHLQTYPGVTWSPKLEAIENFSRFINCRESSADEIDRFLEHTTWAARFDKILSKSQGKKFFGDLYV